MTELIFHLDPKAGNFKLHFGSFFQKQTRNGMYQSKFSWWRCPRCIHWPPAALMFVMISTDSSDVPLGSELAWSRPSNSGRRLRTGPFHCPSVSTVPFFPNPNPGVNLCPWLGPDTLPLPASPSPQDPVHKARITSFHDPAKHACKVMPRRVVFRQ